MAVEPKEPEPTESCDGLDNVSDDQAGWGRLSLFKPHPEVFLERQPREELNYSGFDMFEVAAPAFWSRMGRISVLGLLLVLDPKCGVSG